MAAWPATVLSLLVGIIICHGLTLLPCSNETLVLNALNFTNPDFPLAYIYTEGELEDRNCRYLLRGPSNSTLHLMGSVSIGYTLNHYVSFYDGENASAPLLGTRGSQLMSINVQATGASIFIVMTTDMFSCRPMWIEGDNTFNCVSGAYCDCGFAINDIEIAYQPYDYCQPFNATHIVPGEAPVMVREPPNAPGYTYPRNSYISRYNCTWLFTTTPGAVLVVDATALTTYSLEPTDSLVFYDGSSENAPIIFIIAEEYLTATPSVPQKKVQSTHNAIFVKLFTRPGSKMDYLGFTLNVIAFTTCGPSVIPVNLTFAATGGNATYTTFPWFPLMGLNPYGVHINPGYTLNTTCQFLVFTDPGRSLTVSISDLEAVDIAPGDYLTLYDGNKTSSHVMTRMNNDDAGTFVNAMYVTSGNAMLVTFASSTFSTRGLGATLTLNTRVLNPCAGNVTYSSNAQFQTLDPNPSPVNTGFYALHHSNCGFIAQGSTDQRVKLTWQTQLEAHDVMTIVEGAYTYTVTVGSAMYKQGTYISNGTRLEVYFRTNAAGSQYFGLNGNFEIFDLDPPCSLLTPINSVPNYDIDFRHGRTMRPNQTCSWSVDLGAGAYAAVYLASLCLLPTDTVTFYDGADATAPVIVSYSDAFCLFFESDIFATGQVMFISYHTGNLGSPEAQNIQVSRGIYVQVSNAITPPTYCSADVIIPIPSHNPLQALAAFPPRRYGNCTYSGAPDPNPSRSPWLIFAGGLPFNVNATWTFRAGPNLTAPVVFQCFSTECYGFTPDMMFPENTVFVVTVSIERDWQGYRGYAPFAVGSGEWDGSCNYTVQLANSATLNFCSPGLCDGSNNLVCTAASGIVCDQTFYYPGYDLPRIELFPSLVNLGPGMVVTVYDGYSAAAPVLYQWTGPDIYTPVIPENASFTSRDLLVSSGRALTVRMDTTRTTGRTGFFLGAVNAVPQGLCPSTPTLVNFWVSRANLFFPSDNNDERCPNCVWPTGVTCGLWLVRAQLNGGSFGGILQWDARDGDTVYLYDGPDRSAPLIVSATGRFNSIVYRTTGPQFSVYVETGPGLLAAFPPPYSDLQYEGLSLQFEHVGGGVCPPYTALQGWGNANGDKEFDLLRGFNPFYVGDIMIPNVIPTIYPPSLTCEYTLNSPAGFAYTIDFVGQLVAGDSFNVTTDGLPNYVFDYDLTNAGAFTHTFSTYCPGTTTIRLRLSAVDMPDPSIRRVIRFDYALAPIKVLNSGYTTFYPDSCRRGANSIPYALCPTYGCMNWPSPADPFPLYRDCKVLVNIDLSCSIWLVDFGGKPNGTFAMEGAQAGFTFVPSGTTAEGVNAGVAFPNLRAAISISGSTSFNDLQVSPHSFMFPNQTLVLDFSALESCVIISLAGLGPLARVDFSRLYHVSSTLSIGGPSDKIVSLSFPNLYLVAAVTIQSLSALRSIHFPVLYLGCNNFILDTMLSLETIEFAPRTLFLMATTFNALGLTQLDLTNATSQGITVTNNNLLKSFTLRYEVVAGTQVTMTGNYLLASIELPFFRDAPLILSNSKVTTLSLPAYDDSATQYTLQLVDNFGLTSLRLPSVTKIKVLSISRNGIATLSLPTLTHLGILTLDRMAQLQALDLCNLIDGQSTVLTVAKCPQLSCNDTLALFPGQSIASADCSAEHGVFGCEFNQTIEADCPDRTVSCIQAAITSALSGHGVTVHVPAGTYTGCNLLGGLDFLGKELTLEGDGANATVIDCQGYGRALRAVSNEPPTLLIRDIGFTNGFVNESGGLGLISNNAAPTFLRCAFTASTSRAQGGALMVIAGTHVTLRDSRIQGCRAEGSGGGGLAVDGAAVTISGGVIQDCSTAGDGGALQLTSTTALTEIDGVVVSGNAAERGGGIYSDSALALSDTRLEANSAAQFGGGLAAVPGETLNVWYNLSGCAIRANTASGGGGGIFGYSANVLLSQSHVMDNSAGSDGGGGLWGTCSQNYRILYNVLSPCGVVVRAEGGSSFVGNVAPTGDGGAIRADQIELMLSDSLLMGNTAANGGAIKADTTAVTARNVTIQSNAASQSGGGIYVAPLTGIIDIATSQFLSNSATQSGGGVYFCVAACPNTTAGDPTQQPLPAISADGTNVFAFNAMGAGGYGALIASDPTRLTWQTPPASEAISGRSVSSDASASLTVLVADSYNQVVTRTASVLTLSLVVTTPNGDSVDYISLGGTQTVLADNGIAVFDGVTMIAANASLLDTTYLLTAQLSEIDGVAIASPVRLLPCAAGQGRTSADSAITCDDCAGGTASAVGDNLCVACAAGSYSDARAASCTPCAVNTHAPTAGAAACVACPEGYTAGEGQAECLQQAQIGGLSSSAVAGTVSGVAIGVLLIICIIVFCLYRAARRRTMQKYYLDNDATIRTGNVETPLQKEVKRIILANSTTRIGGGLYSNVYKAKYENKWIAVKVIKGEMATNGTAQQEFRREAVALSRLEERHHPGIVQLQFFLNFNPMCIGVAFCTGGSLKRALAQGIFHKPEEKARLAAEAASAFTVVHTANMVHLDIKTDNILLSPDLHIIVADFGIARVLGMGAAEPELPNEYAPGDTTVRVGDSTGSNGVSLVKLVTSSEAHDTAFTPQYVDPIRILVDRNNDEPYLKRADVFSFGMLMWAIYSEEEPYVGENPEALVERLRENPRLRPRHPLDGCPAFYDSLMTRCWHEDPLQRPTFDEVFDVLKVNLERHYGVTLGEGYANPYAFNARPVSTSLHVSEMPTVTDMGTLGGMSTMATQITVETPSPPLLTPNAAYSPVPVAPAPQPFMPPPPANPPPPPPPSAHDTTPPPPVNNMPPPPPPPAPPLPERRPAAPPQQHARPMSMFIQ